ncbi:MAG: (Fe-S)-binding protein [Limnochordaceae bacterium]|nr:(Fe-S)-binding protein [Limnochordaceae bacterium]
MSPFITDLDRCLKCGFCMGPCPTYAESGLETDAARGRLNLIQQRYAPVPAPFSGLFEASPEPIDGPARRQYFEALFACLECGACVAACPAGVPVTEVISAARADWQRLFGLPWVKRIAIQGVLGHPTVLRVGARLGALGQGLIMRSIGSASDSTAAAAPAAADADTPAAANIDASDSTAADAPAPTDIEASASADADASAVASAAPPVWAAASAPRSAANSVATGGGVQPTEPGAQQPRFPLPWVGRRVFPKLAKRSLIAQLAREKKPVHPQQRVAFFPGCLISQAYTDVGIALHHILAENQVEMVTPAKWSCCGMPAQVHGAWVQARRQVLHNLQIMEDLQKAGMERILTACGSCGAQLRHHATALFRNEPEIRARLEQAAARVRDASEYLVDELHVQAGPYRLARPATVTYHDPCHLARSQGVRRQPRELLQRIPGVTFVEMAEADRCCGGAGIYFLEHPQLSDRIRQRKVDHFRESGAQLLSTACPACMMQLEDGLVQGKTGGQAVHLLELLDDSYRPPHAQRRYRAVKTQLAHLHTHSHSDQATE